MNFLKSKRGSNDAFSWSWSKLVNLIVAFVFIFIPVFAFVILVTNSEYFERNYLATDVALVSETALSSPNDLIYLYDKDMKSFSIDIQEKYISIYKKENNIIDKASSKSFYVNNPSKKVEYGIIDPIYEKEDSGKETVIPMKLVITSIKKDVRAYNANDESLN